MIVIVGREPAPDGHGVLLSPRPAFSCAFTGADVRADGWSVDDLCGGPGEFHALTSVHYLSVGVEVTPVPLCAEHAAHVVACPCCASNVDRVTPVR